MAAHIPIPRGARYGRLTVQHRVSNAPTTHVRYMCKCDCGNTTNSYATALRNGKAKSCGCARYEIASDPKQVRIAVILDKVRLVLEEEL